MTSCSSICTSWIAISSSCPPLACTNALLWPFQCAVWPFVALLQYEAWSGICVATIYDSSPYRDCRPAAPPPHDCHGHYSFGTNAAHSSERCLIMCFETGISPSHFILRKFLQVSFSSGSRFPCVCLCFRGIYCTSSLSTLGTSYFHDLCVCHIIRS